MTELTERLRNLEHLLFPHFTTNEAAAEIERLTAELAFYDNKCDKCDDHLGLLAECPHCREIERLTAQLPDGMKDCTIRFKACPEGHGRLTADNWVEIGCHLCEVNRLYAEIAELKEEVYRRDCDLEGVNEELVNLRQFIEFTIGGIRGIHPILAGIMQDTYLKIPG